MTLFPRLLNKSGYNQRAVINGARTEWNLVRTFCYGNFWSTIQVELLTRVDVPYNQDDELHL